MKSLQLFVSTILLIFFNPFCSLFGFVVVVATTKASHEIPPNFIVFKVNGLHSKRITDEVTIVPYLEDIAEKGIILDSFYTCPDSASTLFSFFSGKNTAVSKDEVGLCELILYRSICFFFFFFLSLSSLYHDAVVCIY